MQDLNVATFTGRVGFIKSDTTPRAKTYITLFSSDDYKDKDDQWVDRDNALPITFWGKDNIPNYISVGDLVYVVAKVTTLRGDDNKTIIYINGDKITKLVSSTKNNTAPNNNPSSSPRTNSKPQKVTEMTQEDLDALFESSTV